MKKVFTALLLIFLSSSLFSQEVILDNVNSTVNNRRVNIGLKTGFTSTIYLTSNFHYNGIKINNVQNNYKIGYNTSFFLRFNLKKHFIQPEFSYVINRCEIQFNRDGSYFLGNPSEYATITSKIHSLDFPILYGYNFIKQGIYGMSFFVGPKVKFNLKQKQDISYKNFDVSNFEEKLYPLNVGLTVGLSVYISKVFFDFRYEQILHNISKSVSYALPEGIESFGQIKLHRRDNMLSFSLGVIL